LVLREVGVSLYLYSERWEYHFIITQRGWSITLLVLREAGVITLLVFREVGTNKVILPPLSAPIK
jgi:hypothetical protein